MFWNCGSQTQFSALGLALKKEKNRIGNNALQNVDKVSVTSCDFCQIHMYVHVCVRMLVDNIKFLIEGHGNIKFESHWLKPSFRPPLRLRPNDSELHSRKIWGFCFCFCFWKDNASSLMIGWAKGFNENFQFCLKKETFIGHTYHML